MKIIFFTPVIRSSAIGRVSSLIVRAMISFGHEILVVRSENARFFDQPSHDFGFGTEVIPWCDFNQIHSLLRSADTVIYQVGDNYDFHQGCVTWLSEVAGIVCLHDFFLGNLFYGWAQNYGLEARAILRTWYGSVTADEFFSYPNADLFIEKTRKISPMTEWICSMAQSVITHSSWDIERVLNACPGPVHIVPLAYDTPHAKLTKPFVPKTKKDSLHVLTFGHIDKNKRVASVIQAIRKSRFLRKKAVYQLIGHITEKMRNELSALAKENRVKLIISGEVEDSVLAEAIERADIVTCLRWPALEASSLSTIEALYYAKPTLVTNSGFYSEIPDSCTIKINPENEIIEIKAALKKLKNNPEYLYALGQQGQQWAMKTFTAENYALKLIELVLATTRSKVITNAIDYFSKILYGWGGKRELLGKEYIIKPLSIFAEDNSSAPLPLIF